MALTLLVAAAVLALDQGAKALVMARMAVGESRAIIPNLLNFTYIRNPGAAYGLLSGSRWFLAAAALAMTGVALYLAPRLKQPWERVALGLLIGGALGNMIDRVRFGLVTDFFEVIPLRIFQVFNLADVAITACVVLVAAEWVFNRKTFGD